MSADPAESAETKRRLPVVNHLLTIRLFCSASRRAQSRSGTQKACPERPRFNSAIIPGMSPSVCRLIDKTSQLGVKGPHLHAESML
ncbi:hypothetical protein MUO32_28535 [Shinella sp. CPCC 101442]|uniref:hypothetical protein n=1 Tax=Shinella sp. CPCC 101442 TaxID=2932265 RepID=UPI0021521AFB|nr:hypothetical protein [Shinella sp. CPCC 101442]MCR6502977.1 hypothetical protein [Shinella sp. CPCC 101442]